MYDKIPRILGVECTSYLLLPLYLLHPGVEVGCPLRPRHYPSFMKTPGFPAPTYFTLLSVHWTFVAVSKKFSQSRK